MSAVQLLQPILNDEFQRNNFFNGRLLSAEDLRAEQDASRVEDAHLARAIGDGVAWGLRVSALSLTPARVRVTSGLALNRLGDRLSLSADAEVALVPAEREAATETSAGLFANCERFDRTPTGTVTVASGAYLLVISPASGYRGTALVSDPNSTGAGRGSCGPRFTVEGVRFRLIEITFDDFASIGTTIGTHIGELLPPAGADKTQRLRNLLAHACFGSAALRDYFTAGAEPLGSNTEPAGWGALDAIRYHGELTDCDVPLALAVFDANGGMSFLDMWSARRKLIDAAAVESWRAVAGPRRIAEGEAAFLQFQSQLDVVKRLERPGNIAATKYFDYLPPAGWLPVGPDGLQWRTFLGVHSPPDVTPVDASLLRGIIERSWFDEAFALDTTPPVPLRVYQVPRQNFVVFARSSTGSIRVTLSPAPSGSPTVEVTAVSKSGPTRRGTTRTGGVVPIPDLDPGPYKVSANVQGFIPATSAELIVVGGRTVEIGVELTPLPNGTVLVTAVDVMGNLVTTATIIASSGGVTLTGAPVDAGKYRIADLPPNTTFILTGTAAGYKQATTSAIGPIAAGEEKTAILVFESSVVPKPKPSRCVYVAKINKPPLQKVRLCLVLSATEFDEQYYYTDFVKKAEKRGKSGTEFGVKERADTWTKGNERYVSYGGQIVYSKPPWIKMAKLEPESPDVNQWLADWADWLATDLDDERIRAANPIVKLDPKYVIPTKSQEVPSKPAGYAVFGDFGVPLAIQPEYGLTPVPVPNDPKYFPWLGKDWFDRMCQSSLCWVDDVPWLWDEFMIDLTGDPRDLVREIMGDHMEKVKEIITDRSYLPGVDKTLNDALKAGGFGDNVSLANGTVDEIAAKVGSKTAAMKLILSARNTVPEDAWSLDSLNLATEQKRGLNERGVASLGEFNAYARENRTETTKVLGLEGRASGEIDKALTELTGDAQANMTRGSVEIGAKSTVNELAGVSAPMAAKLAESNLGSTEALAGATKEDVAAATNLSVGDAQVLIDTASAATKESVTIDIVAGVTAEETARLNEAVGVEAGTNATVADVIAMGPEKVAEALNPGAPDVSRSTALISGLQQGVTSTRQVTTTRLSPTSGTARLGGVTGISSPRLPGMGGFG